MVYVPFGLIEWHGRHLPLGNDAIKAHAILVKCAENFGGVVYPPVYFHADFKQEHLVPVLTDLFTRLKRTGYRVILGVSGHNIPEQIDIIDKALAPVIADGTVAGKGFWEMTLSQGPESNSDHAAKCETSGDPATMKLLPEHAKLTGYFNIDNGTGALRGVYLQGNEAIAPVFEAWMEPFRNIGMTTLTIRNTSGTDHLSFNAVGLPGFQFIQDPVEYSTLSHHSNLDVYERVQPADMMKNAVIVASFVYHAANRDQLLPRKPLPKPQPARMPPM